MKHLIIGYGEVGKAVNEVICLNDADIFDKNYVQEKYSNKYDMLHICIEYSNEFVKEVKKYANRYQPDSIIIYSTVPIGTTEQLEGAVHSPIEGKHPNLANSIRINTRWIGGSNLLFEGWCREIGLIVREVKESKFTEALKLLSTTEYGINIEFARYKKMVSDSIGMDYELTKIWNGDYNRLYNHLGLGDKYQKFVLDAPEGPKGGHCVTPNAILLDKQFPSNFTKIVGEL